MSTGGWHDVDGLDEAEMDLGAFRVHLSHWLLQPSQDWVREALQKNPHWVNAVLDEGGQTPLHFVMGLSAPLAGLVDFLVVSGANLEALDASGQTPLKRAVVHAGSLHSAPLSSMQSLITAGADVWGRPREDRSSWTLLHIATENTRNLVVKALLEQGGVDLLEAEGPQGRRALHMAIQADSVSTAQILLDHGASLTATDSGPTPLALARDLEDHQNWKPLILLLLSRGSDPRDAPLGFQHHTVATSLAALGDTQGLFKHKESRDRQGCPIEATEMESALSCAMKEGHVEAASAIRAWMASQAIDAVMQQALTKELTGRSM
jgi:hypothetical protein